MPFPKVAPIPANELLPIDYKERHAHLREHMERHGYAAMIGYSNAKLHGMTEWMAGFYPTFVGWQTRGPEDWMLFGTSVVLFPLEGEPVLLLDQLWDVHRAAQESAVSDARGSIDFGVDLAKIIKEKGIKGQIGIEPWHVFPAEVYLKLVGLLDQGEVRIGPSRLMEELRMVKTPAEIQRIRHAERITEVACQFGLDLVKAGITEHELACNVEHVMRLNGELHLGANSIVGAGPRTAQGSSQPKRDVVVKDGDLVIFDIVGRSYGYCGDISRVRVAGGDPSPELQKLFDTVLTMNREIINAAKPGVLPGDLHKLAHKIALDAGYKEENLSTLTGHGIGLDIHERPDYGPDSVPLQENNVITVEPIILVPGLAGIRIEDVILITENGAEQLSTIPHTLV